MENIRTTSTIKNYAEVTDGEIKNVKLKNIEINFFDRATELHESMIEYLGDSLLSFKGAEHVRLQDIEIFGSLYGIDKTLVVENCKSFVKENVNF